MRNPTDSIDATPSRLSYPKFAVLLELPNLGELLKLRAQCISDGILFPMPGPGGFLQCDAIAFRNTIAARNAAQVISPPISSAALNQERRAVIERRKP